MLNLDPWIPFAREATPPRPYILYLSTGLASESLADTGLKTRDSWARISVIFLNFSRNFEGRCIRRWVSKSLSIK